MVDVTNFTMADTPMMTLVKRSIFFGLCAIIAGHIASYIVKMYANISLPDMVRNFNIKYIMELIKNLDYIGYKGPIITSIITFLSLLEKPTYLFIFIIGSFLNYSINNELKMIIKEKN